MTKNSGVLNLPFTLTNKRDKDKYKVIDKEGNEIKIGDKVTTFRGETGTLTNYDPGRVYVKLPSWEYENEWFPGVINCEIVPR